MEVCISGGEEGIDAGLKTLEILMNVSRGAFPALQDRSNLDPTILGQSVRPNFKMVNIIFFMACSEADLCLVPDFDKELRVKARKRK